jgi:SAM-dependent methyltransferase
VAARLARDAEGTGRAPEPSAILDVGTGTGSLALAAAERWEHARVIGLDASGAMLSVARWRSEHAREAGAAEAPLGLLPPPTPARAPARVPGAAAPPLPAAWPVPDAGRLEWHIADAAAMPLGDGAVDVAVSAFMLQLVTDRRAVLAEIHRVLRPGGVLGLVTWLADDLVMPPDTEFDEAVYDLGLEDPDPDGDAEPLEDIESPEALRSDLSSSAFEAIEIDVEKLHFGWTRQGYLAFKEAYDEWDLFTSLAPADRVRLRERVEARWAGLPDADFTLRAPLVAATARRA